jgi:hypothetical protein
MANLILATLRHPEASFCVKDLLAAALSSILIGINGITEGFHGNVELMV